MPGKIFVNYRRDDERAFAARIRDRLANAFGASNVFMHVDNLLAGQRFDRELEKALGQCDVFVAIIGRGWVELLTSRAASDEPDYVREEIAAALMRGVVVIPVLIERTALPRGADPPDDVRDMVLHQKHDITHEYFGRDTDTLISAIRAVRKSIKSQARTVGGGSRFGVILAATAVFLGGALPGSSIGYDGCSIRSSRATSADLAVGADAQSGGDRRSQSTADIRTTTSDVRIKTHLAPGWTSHRPAARANSR